MRFLYQTDTQFSGLPHHLVCLRLDFPFIYLTALDGMGLDRIEGPYPTPTLPTIPV